MQYGINGSEPQVWVCAGWLLLRDGVQASLTPMLVPAWLMTEWTEGPFALELDDEMKRL
jgi:hypothetical protein